MHTHICISIRFVLHVFILSIRKSAHAIVQKVSDIIEVQVVPEIEYTLLHPYPKQQLKSCFFYIFLI